MSISIGFDRLNNDSGGLIVPRQSPERVVHIRRTIKQGERLMLKAYTRNVGTTAIVCLQGRIVNGETVALRNAVNSEVYSNRIVLDLSRVNTIDAHGLGVLVELREQTRSKGIEFKLMNVTQRVSYLLNITRLNTVFEVISHGEFLRNAPRSRNEAMELVPCA